VQAFLAACRCREPAEVYTLFSPYLTADVNVKKKKSTPAYEKRNALLNLLMIRGSRRYHEPGERSFAEILDPQWLDLAVQLDESDLVQALAVPGHAGANALLAELFKQQLGKAGTGYEVVGVLDTMIRVGHPEATDAVIEVIKRAAKAKYYYGYNWFGNTIARLPKAEALPKLEALLPTLPEKMIDQLLGYIAELKQSAPTE
jgi:hypothetical protein